jgi:hypothetical protein
MGRQKFAFCQDDAWRCILMHSGDVEACREGVGQRRVARASEHGTSPFSKGSIVSNIYQTVNLNLCV